MPRLICQKDSAPESCVFPEQWLKNTPPDFISLFTPPCRVGRHIKPDLQGVRDWQIIPQDDGAKDGFLVRRNANVGVWESA